VIPYSLIDRYQRFGGYCCLCLRGRIQHSCFTHKMGTVGFCRTMVPMYSDIRRHNPEDPHQHENFGSHIKKIFMRIPLNWHWDCYSVCLLQEENQMLWKRHVMFYVPTPVVNWQVNRLTNTRINKEIRLEAYFPVADFKSLLCCIYLSMALQPFVGPWPLFQFLDLFTQSVGLLQQRISPSKGHRTAKPE
jgi:hypothetical protein